MEKTWTGWIAVRVGKVSTKEIREHPERYEEYFPDPNNPTDEQARKYLEQCKMWKAESNDGSELLAGADLDVDMNELASK